MSPEETPKLVEGNFQLQIQLTQNRSLTLSSYLYHGESTKEFNDRLDKYQAVLDRQSVLVDIVNKKAQREALLAGIEQHRDELAHLRAMQGGTIKEGGQEKRVKLTSQQLEILKRGDESIRGLTKQISMLDHLIAAAQKKLEAEE